MKKNLKIPVSISLTPEEKELAQMQAFKSTGRTNLSGYFAYLINQIDKKQLIQTVKNKL